MPARSDDQWFLDLEGDLRRFATETAFRPRVAARKSWEPRIDVLEEPHRLLVRVEVPGVKTSEIEIAYIESRHTLQIRGVRHEDQSEISGRVGVHQLEILYGEFERELRLPDGPIDSDGIRARFLDGMLTISLPKREPRTSQTTITIVTR